tara:strand:+ start:354 stop:728 length:375 start_codon:yes stop_codon:yes gene_type:complete
MLLETLMEDQDLEDFRTQLEGLRQEILGESEGTLQDMQEESTLYPDPNDRAAMETEHITVLRLRDRERKLLGKIGEALEHIEDGSFGFCEKCGVDIGVERLKIRPVTTYCIACKEEQEAGESRN